MTDQTWSWLGGSNDALSGRKWNSKNWRIKCLSYYIELFKWKPGSGKSYPWSNSQDWVARAVFRSFQHCSILRIQKDQRAWGQEGQANKCSSWEIQHRPCQAKLITWEQVLGWIGLNASGLEGVQIEENFEKKEVGKMICLTYVWHPLLMLISVPRFNPHSTKVLPQHKFLQFVSTSPSEQNLPAPKFQLFSSRNPPPNDSQFRNDTLLLNRLLT